MNTEALPLIRLAAALSMVLAGPLAPGCSDSGEPDPGSEAPLPSMQPGFNDGVSECLAACPQPQTAVCSPLDEGPGVAGLIAPTSFTKPVGKQSGTAVAGAGDVNGDQRADIVVGSAFTQYEYPWWRTKWHIPSSGGSVVIVSGFDGEWPVGSRGSLLHRIESKIPYYGSAVASLGDVNGDGRADVAIAAFGADAYAGRVERWSANGAGVWSRLDTIEGAVGSRTGFSIANLGDLDADGPWLAVAAPGTRTVTTYDATATAGWTFTEDHEDGAWAVASAGGDLNGDGVDDVLVGSPWATIGDAQYAGRVAMISGADGTLLGTTDRGAGAARLDNFGYALAGLGDVDADGVADFAVAAPSADSPASNGGVVLLFSGASAMAGDGAGFAASTELRTSFGGTTVNGGFGLSLAAAADVDGDGAVDLLIGEPGYKNTGGDTVGRALLVSLDKELPIAAFAANGLNAEHYGYSVSGAGDINGDGVADVLVGGRVETVTPPVPDGDQVYCQGNVLRLKSDHYSAQGEHYDCADSGMVCKTLAGKSVPGCHDEATVSESCDGSNLVWVNGSDTYSLDCGFYGTTCQVTTGGARCVKATQIESQSLTEFGATGQLTGPTARAHFMVDACNAARACGPHGECGEGTCSCAEGFMGECCDVPIGGGACTTNDDCVNGTCGDDGCVCPSAWAGALCDLSLCAPGTYGASCTDCVTVATAKCGSGDPADRVHVAPGGGVVAGGGDYDGDGAPDVAVGMPSAYLIGTGATCTADVDCGAGLDCFESHEADAPGACAASSDCVHGTCTMALCVCEANWGGVTCDEQIGRCLAESIDTNGAVGVVSGADGSVVWSLAGEDGELAGASVALADMNGDRRADVIVGSPMYDVGRGRVRVFLAGQSTDEPWLEVTGGQQGERLGTSVAAGADLDGDGRADLITGAPGFGLTADDDDADDLNDLGRVYVVSGASGQIAGWIQGAVASAGLGTVVALVPSMDTDTTADIAVGMPFAQAEKGLVRVYSGASLGQLWSRVGALAKGQYGVSLAGVGAVCVGSVCRTIDNDTRGDLIVGSSAVAEKVEVLSASGGLLRTLTLESGSDAAFGASVADAGDLNGDGIPDIAVGAPGTLVSDALRGAVYGFSGADDLAQLFVVEGTQTSDSPDGARFGASIAAIGDLNGDGASALAVGVPRANATASGQLKSGRLEIVHYVERCRAEALCGFGGTCDEGAGGTGDCSCGITTSSSACASTPCSPNPCQNGGSCVAATAGHPVCTCAGGYGGALCETACPSVDDVLCGGHGICAQTTGGCHCEQGWKGADCGARILACGEPGACVHGVCDYNGECVCTAGWFGVACDQRCKTTWAHPHVRRHEPGSSLTGLARGVGPTGPPELVGDLLEGGAGALMYYTPADNGSVSFVDVQRAYDKAIFGTELGHATLTPPSDVTRSSFGSTRSATVDLDGDNVAEIAVADPGGKVGEGGAYGIVAIYDGRAPETGAEPLLVVEGPGEQRKLGGTVIGAHIRAAGISGPAYLTPMGPLPGVMVITLDQQVIFEGSILSDHSALLGDIDGDGFDEIAGHGTGVINIYSGDGLTVMKSISYSDAQFDTLGTGMLTGDLNGDEKPDIVFLRLQDYKVCLSPAYACTDYALSSLTPYANQTDYRLLFSGAVVEDLDCDGKGELLLGVQDVDTTTDVPKGNTEGSENRYYVGAGVFVLSGGDLAKQVMIIDETMHVPLDGVTDAHHWNPAPIAYNFAGGISALPRSASREAVDVFVTHEDVMYRAGYTDSVGNIVDPPYEKTTGQAGGVILTLIGKDCGSTATCGGAGSCDAGGACQCDTGFLGTACQVDINYCEGAPCKSEQTGEPTGVCHDGLTNYTCVCEPGWVGGDCQADFDNCFPDSDTFYGPAASPYNNWGEGYGGPFDWWGAQYLLPAVTDKTWNDVSPFGVSAGVVTDGTASVVPLTADDCIYGLHGYPQGEDMELELFLLSGLPPVAPSGVLAQRTVSLPVVPGFPESSNIAMMYPCLEVSAGNYVAVRAKSSGGRMPVSSPGDAGHTYYTLTPASGADFVDGPTFLTGPSPAPTLSAAWTGTPAFGLQFALQYVCRNNGMCIDALDQFECRCLHGSYGYTCEHTCPGTVGVASTSGGTPPDWAQWTKDGIFGGGGEGTPVSADVCNRLGACVSQQAVLPVANTLGVAATDVTVGQCICGPGAFGETCRRGGSMCSPYDVDFPFELTQAEFTRTQVSDGNGVHWPCDACSSAQLAAALYDPSKCPDVGGEKMCPAVYDAGHTISACGTTTYTAANVKTYATDRAEEVFQITLSSATQLRVQWTSAYHTKGYVYVLKQSAPEVTLGCPVTLDAGNCVSLGRYDATATSTGFSLVTEELSVGTYFIVVEGMDTGVKQVNTELRQKGYDIRIVEGACDLSECQLADGTTRFCGTMSCGEGQLEANCPGAQACAVSVGKASNYYGELCDGGEGICYIRADRCKYVVAMSYDAESKAYVIPSGNFVGNPNVALARDDFHFDAGDCRGAKTWNAGAGADDMVFKLQAAITGWHAIQLSSVASGFNPVLWLASQCVPETESDVDDHCIGASNGAGNGGAETLIEWLEEDTSYYVIVDGKWPQTAVTTKTFQLTAKFCHADDKATTVDINSCTSGGTP